MILTPFSRVVWTIIRKDLQAEFRSRELVTSMLLFSFLSVMIFSFALELNRQAEREVVGGVLWVTVVFASILGLNRSLANEREQGSLDAMVLAPISRTAIYMGKMVGNFIFSLIIGAILLPLMTILFNVPLAQPLMLLVLGLGILGISAIGTLLSTMTVQSRSRETLLPIAMMPVTLPVILIGVQAAGSVIEGTPDTSWLATLVFIDLMYLALGFILFEYVVED